MARTDASTAPSKADAEATVARMREMSADLRGCSILDASGAALAATGASEPWGEAAGELWAAADGAGEEPAAQVHVGTEDGEVFAVRDGALAMVAVADRFALASLMVHDMRMVLHDLSTGHAGAAHGLEAG